MAAVDTADPAPARRMSDALLRIVVIDADPARASIIEDGLREAGHRAVTVIAETRGLLRRLLEREPHVIVINLEHPNRDVLEQMFQVSCSSTSPTRR